MKSHLQSLAARVQVGLASPNDLVESGILVLTEGGSSKSFTLLAGENPKNSYYVDLKELFIDGLEEEGIKYPNRDEAESFLLIETLEGIANGTIDPSIGMSFIDNNLDHLSLFPVENNYVGEHLGLERCYTWYRELQDYSDGSTLFYHTDLPRDEAAQKFREHLKDEAQKALETIKTKIRTI